MKQFDVMVLGAGMVGLGTALALLSHGRSVALVDRRGPAQETSYGNAGLIQAEAVMPYAFPRDLSVVLGTLTGRRTDARIAWRALASTAPWLVRYAANSGVRSVMKTARANAPLVARAVPSHRRLTERAQALHLWKPGGYLRVYRDSAALERAARAEEQVRDTFAIPSTVLGRDAVAALEPHLCADLAGALHFSEPVKIDDPGDLGEAYARLFEDEGGEIVSADAFALERDGAGFVLGAVRAREVVVALGPWSADFLSRFGVRIPLGVKRGYHRHFRAKGNAVLGRLVVDEDAGFVLSPNRRGIRVSTGAEFARRDDPPTPVQITQVERLASGLFPIGEAVESQPWLGSRPCMPDLLPMVGRIAKVPGLWANFAHHHLGFTLGPATGELLAQMITGSETFTDPLPYAPARYGA
ncbi:MAG: FAD-dependent oxidoreductase [Pseudomonadota bacterium]